MSPTLATPFDDLDPHAGLRPAEIAERLGVSARSVRRVIARGELRASRACGIRVLVADAASWWREHCVPAAPPERPASVPLPRSVEAPRRRRVVRPVADGRLPLPPRGGA